MLLVFRWQSFVDSFFCYYILDVFIAIPYLSIWSFLIDRACLISCFQNIMVFAGCENRLRYYVMIYIAIVQSFCVCFFVFFTEDLAVSILDPFFGL